MPAIEGANDILIQRIKQRLPCFLRFADLGMQLQCFSDSRIRTQAANQNLRDLAS